MTATTARCAVGERIGQRNIQEGAIPVLSCEGACIRGEIARLAANRVGNAPGFRRACHGELFAVPDSAMASWVRSAREVVVIDGCPLKCHGRILEHLVEPQRIRHFNALARYRKFCDLFDIDAVPEAERRSVADDVARWVVAQVDNPGRTVEANAKSCAASESADAPTQSSGAPCCGGSKTT